MWQLLTRQLPKILYVEICDSLITLLVGTKNQHLHSQEKLQWNLKLWAMSALGEI